MPIRRASRRAKRFHLLSKFDRNKLLAVNTCYTEKLMLDSISSNEQKKTIIFIYKLVQVN